jgi:hypothetical protein
VYFVRLLTVYLALGFGKPPEQRDAALFDPLRTWAGRYELADFSGIAARMNRRRMGMIMMPGGSVVMVVDIAVSIATLFLRVVMICGGWFGNVYFKLRPGDSLFASPCNVQVPAADVQRAQLPFEFGHVHTQNQHRAKEHVAADSAAQIKVKRFHFFITARALIWLAAYPAPNPLSMFTTVTPLAQLFSIVNSAAIPPKLAP